MGKTMMTREKPGTDGQIDWGSGWSAQLMYGLSSGFWNVYQQLALLDNFEVRRSVTVTRYVVECAEGV